MVLQNDYSWCPKALSAMEAHYDQLYKEFQPWLITTDQTAQEQKLIQYVLGKKAGATFGDHCFVAKNAIVATNTFHLGNNSWVAAGAIIRGNVSIGANSTVNPYAHIAGFVTIGNGVRIAGFVSIYGFNHGFSRTDIDIYQQPHTYDGVIIGNGTWIGANAVITDGTKIGDHCIVAAGAIVTQNFPDYSIIGGNPARIIKNRRDTVG